MTNAVRVRSASHVVVPPPSTVLRPRDPNVEGPGGFFFGAPQAPGILTLVEAADGQAVEIYAR
jgi:hypothetical protein